MRIFFSIVFVLRFFAPVGLPASKVVTSLTVGERTPRKNYGNFRVCKAASYTSRVGQPSALNGGSASPENASPVEDSPWRARTDGKGVRRRRHKFLGGKPQRF